jgi:hypothetical protein
MIFLDRSIPRPVADALKCVREDVLWLEDEFGHDTPDTIWLPAVGARGWLVIVRDKRIRTRPGERRALIAGRVGCFALTQKQALTPWQYLRLIVPALDQMEGIFATVPRPFLYALNGQGQLRQLRLWEVDRLTEP